MFPTIDRNMKQRDNVTSANNVTPSSGYDKIVADNTSKMVEILQAVVRSNDNLNSKTERLLAVSEHMMSISQNMARVSEQMMSLNEENVKWLKRLDKRMYHINQSLMGNGSAVPLQERAFRSPEKDRGGDSSKAAKDEEEQPKNEIRGLNDVRLKSFEQNHELAMMRRESDLSKSSRLLVPFSSLHDKEVSNGTVCLNDLKIELATWVGELYRQITSNVYARYIGSVYSEDEARLVFCQSVILNNLQMMSWFREHNKSFWNKQRYQILKHVTTCSKKILGFLKVKVPRNKKNFKSLEFENMVERVNNSDDPRYDILKNAQLWFDAKENDKDVHYIKEIKTLFNTLITKVEEEYPTFNRTMVEIFTNKEENSKVKYLIGKKFKDNIPKFSEEELNTLSFKCKSPEILRILIKWLEEMQDMIKNPEEYINKKKVFKSYKREAKDPVPVSEKIKKQIIRQIEKSSERLKGKFDNVKDILSDLINNVSELVFIKPESSEFLDHEDIKAIKFSQLISESLPFLAVTRIEMIVQVCRSFQIEHKSALLEMVDLLTFSVFDLLRCKCIGSKAEIQQIYRRLRQHPYLELIRVKNRLDTPLNDILINCRVKGSPLICEVQLLITNELITEKSDKNEHFNHFLYELQRSKFGPLCEACIIINDSDPRMQYIDELKKIKMKMPPLTKEQEQSLDLVGPVKRCYNNHELKTMHFSIPFVCTMCSIFYKEYSSSFDSYYCEDCNFVICPSCFLDRIKETEKKDNYLLRSDFFRKVFYRDQIYELKSFKGKKLDAIIMDILEQNQSKYCMIISYSQGLVTKKGYKLVGDTIFPTYFTLTKKPARLDDYDKYDVLVLFKEEEIEDLSPKGLVKAGDVETTNTLLTREVIEEFATKEKCNLKCISDDNVILVIDFDESDANIEEVMKLHKLQKTIEECKSSKITTLNISSGSYFDVSLIKTQAGLLSHVLTVVADENNLNSLQPFWALKNLTKLSLKQNQIKGPEKIDLSNMAVFADLFLAVNKFEFFPVIIAPQMTRISFKRNNIVDISNLSNSQLPKLEELGLAENKIVKLPIMNLPAVKKIVLSKNQITDISILNQSTIKKTQTLEIESNKIEEMPELDLPELKELNMAKNRISSIDKLAVSDLKQLKALILSKNKITLVPKLQLDKLKVLDLSGNRIQSLTHISSQEFPKLLELNLSGNAIRCVPAFHFQSLAKLNLANNEIRTLTQDVGGQPSHFFDSNLPSITSISLALTNKFLVKQLVLMEMNRWFTTAKYLE